MRAIPFLSKIQYVEFFGGVLHVWRNKLGQQCPKFLCREDDSIFIIHFQANCRIANTIPGIGLCPQKHPREQLVIHWERRQILFEPFFLIFKKICNNVVDTAQTRMADEPGVNDAGTGAQTRADANSDIEFVLNVGAEVLCKADEFGAFLSQFKVERDRKYRVNASCGLWV
jgi:CRISPR/Cas system-associated endoribonuclease Cas2